MSVKDRFTPEEWMSLLKTPMLVSYAVVGAAPSGEDGFIQEMSAVADAIVEGGEGAVKDSLLASVVADIVANARTSSADRRRSSQLKKSGRGRLSTVGRWPVF